MRVPVCSRRAREADGGMRLLLIGAEPGNGDVSRCHKGSKTRLLHVLQSADAFGHVLRRFALAPVTKHIFLGILEANVERGLFGAEQALVHLVAGRFTHSGCTDQPAHAQGKGQTQQQSAQGT